MHMFFTSNKSILANTIVYLVLDTVFVAARFVLRWKTKSFGIDDWFCIPALVSYRFD